MYIHKANVLCSDKFSQKSKGNFFNGSLQWNRDAPLLLRAIGIGHAY